MPRPARPEPGADSSLTSRRTPTVVLVGAEFTERLKAHCRECERAWIPTPADPITACYEPTCEMAYEESCIDCRIEHDKAYHPDFSIDPEHKETS